MAWFERTLLQLELIFLTRRLASSPQDYASIIPRMSDVSGRILQLDTWPTVIDAGQRWMAK